MKAEVRRLTPTECCRLQGIPDKHPFIHGDETSESSVYSAQGNGWARNCSRLVFKRIHLVDGKHNGCVRPFKIGSVSSGQGTHELSVEDFGDKSVFFSEIAPFPCEILSTRFPDVPNLGDVTRISFDHQKRVIHNRKKNGYELMPESQLGFKPIDVNTIEIPIEYGEIDCISGGLPCTSISVAGKRHGAAEGSGTRSALAYELPRIGKECGARWLVYENVPGLFSSNGGTDFVWFLYRLQEAGYSVAWRTFDARYVRSDLHPRACPQRRRRIWLVAYRGTDWRIPCETLFDPIKALGTEPPVLTCGVGFTAKYTGDENRTQTKTELEEFREFLNAADKRILDRLADKGICITAEDRIKELEYDERKSQEEKNLGLDLFDGDLFGQTEDTHQGRGLKQSDIDLHMPTDADIRSVGMANVYLWAKTVCADVSYCGEMFDKEPCAPDVENITPQLLSNIGNAGFLSNGICVTMKMPEWNAGITQEELATMPRELSEIYDGDVCGLADILEESVDPKYKLSWRACYGILNRVIKRAKKIPIELGYALIVRIIDQAPFVKWQMENGKDDAKFGFLSQREIAKQCFEMFISFMVSINDIQEIDPKSVGVDTGTDEECTDADDLENDTENAEGASDYNMVEGCSSKPLDTIKA